MSKISIKSIIKNITEDEEVKVNCTGYKENNRIIYKDNDIDVTILINTNKIGIVRENDIYKLNLNFELNNSYSTYELKENNLKFDLDIVLKELNIENNKIEIKYNLDCEYLYRLEYNIKE